MIRIGFSTTSSPVSAAIRWMTRSRCSHAWLLLTGEHAHLGVSMVLEATGKGVHTTPYLDFEKDNKIISVFEIPWDLTDGVVWALSSSRPYDTLGLFANAWMKIGKWFKRNWHNPMSSPEALFCSELVVRVMGPGICQLPPETTSPEDLRRWLEKSPAATDSLR